MESTHDVSDLVATTSPIYSSPAASLTTLSKELLSSIFEYIRFRDTYSLLTTCKSIYPTARQYLWFDLTFTDGKGKTSNRTAQTRDSDDNRYDEGKDEELRFIKYTFQSRHERAETDRQYLQPQAWNRLIEMTKQNDESLGWSYTRRISIHGSTMVFNKDFVEMLTDLIESGRLKPRYVYLNLNISDCIDWRYLNGNPPDNTVHVRTRLLLALRVYSESNPFNISFAIRTPSKLIFGSTDVCQLPPENLTFLDLCIRPIPEDVQDIRRLIKDTTQYLNATSNLRSLSISCPSLGESSGWANFQFEPCSEEFADLQNAVSNLAKLRRLRVVSTVFHPEFFLKPPDGLQTLLYQNCSLHKDWWVEFSKAPLPNLEWLKFTHRAGYYVQENFEIGAFACKSLKYFNLGEDDVIIGPRDLIRRVMESNPGLTKKCVLDLQRYEVKPALDKCKGEVFSRVRQYAEDSSAEYRQKWLDGLRGEEFEEAFLKGFLQNFLKEIEEGKLRKLKGTDV